ncbi:hypothetical protein [Saccharibacillus endophyticus]|uniref:DUF3021 domain-containing protein n=1 Tax=Saccharibacillus endophyticus TaxID=2060666 RepID=A0ABQ2A338_9BACL|nr:hypothetical protein [Saccharibacillus endophyticus]GGH83454.1 hypothetical protein GCM10007362_36320 [Saccharibacillus endophyticus]
MIVQLRKSFFQVFTMSLLWIVLLLTFFYRGETVGIGYFWNVVGIAAICAALFGVMYDALWNHLTLKPLWNIAISSVLSIGGAMLGVLLFSKELYDLLLPWLWAMVILSLVLHTLGFYVYARIDSRKQADELNAKLK